MAPKFVQVRAHTQEFFIWLMLIITDDPVKKNGAKKELRIVVNSPGLGV
jgi:hypothetical protein